MTPWGIEPETFRIVAQCLNCTTAYPTVKQQTCNTVVRKKGHIKYRQFVSLMVGPTLHPLASGNKSAVLLILLVRFYS
jgi:hypothetical protein